MKILIAVLNQGWICTPLAESLAKLRPKYPQHDISITFADEKPIDYNRNAIVEFFLKTDKEVLLMLDSDMVIEPNILDMIKPEYPVVSATTFTMHNGIPYPLIMKINNHGYIPMSDPGDKISEYTPVDGVGTGCLYIFREVFAKIEKPYFRFLYGDDGHITLGEDYYFSRKLLEAGIRPHVATEFIVGHFKYFDVAQINQLLYKALMFNKDGVSRVLHERLDPESATKLKRKLENGTRT